MTLNEQDRIVLIEHRIYYGMFYALLGLGLAYKFETSKHSQLIGWFNKNFIHNSRFEPKYGKFINKAVNRRTKSDYDSYVKFEKETVEEMFSEMKEFISEVKQHVQQLKTKRH